MSPIHRTESYGELERVTHTCASDGACRHRWARRAWLPVEPLEERVLARGGLPDWLVGSAVARKWWRACDSRRLTMSAADELAVALLGMHPACVWPEWFR